MQGVEQEVSRVGDGGAWKLEHGRAERVEPRVANSLELVEIVRNSVSIERAREESILAKPRVMVERLFRRSGYPPDKQETAGRTVLEHAGLISQRWLVAG